MNRRDVITALPLTLAAPAAFAEPPIASIGAPQWAPSALSSRGIANLEAFARLVAYVRYFHPSDAAAATDWNQFVIANVAAVEGARNPDDLAQRLESAFSPIAPTLRLFPRPTPPASASAKVETAPNGAPLVKWTHWGVGLTSPSLYRSVRVEVDGGVPAPLPLTLGGGVSGLLPTVGLGKAERLQTPTREAALADARLYSPDDRRVRLAAVIMAWGVLRHFYPYFDEVGADWDAELPKALRRAAEDRDGWAFQTTLSLMLTSLRDSHGNVFFISPKGYLPIGWSWIEDQLVITALPSPPPADLAVGGVIERIDGVSVRNRLAELEPAICASTPQWLRFKSLQLLQQRQDGSPAVLEGQTPHGQPFRVSLAAVSAQEYAKVSPRLARENFSEPRSGVVYVDLSRIVQDELVSRIDQLAAAKGIVLDNRSYPTGPARTVFQHLADRPVRSAKFELPVVTTPDRRDVAYDSRGWTLPPLTPRFAGRVVMLTGGGSISYAESLAGLFEGEQLGPIVGGPTAGTNGDINRLIVPGGYTLIFTGLRVRKQDGSPHHGVGIAPTVPVSQTLAGVRAGRDEVLERGVALALGEV